VKAKLGRLGIRTIFYLDDILVLGSSFQICLANMQEALSLLMKAGIIINWEKSSLVHTTNFTFLGMLWDSVQGVLSPPRTSSNVSALKQPFSSISLPQRAVRSWF
jgi:hypothetical protein